jgi:hypothetical protein
MATGEGRLARGCNTGVQPNQWGDDRTGIRRWRRAHGTCVRVPPSGRPAASPIACHPCLARHRGEHRGVTPGSRRYCYCYPEPGVWLRVANVQVGGICLRYQGSSLGGR